MQPSQQWKAIVKNAWIVGIVVLAGLASTAFYTLSEPARYESSTVLLLNPSLPGSYAPYVPTTDVAARLADNYSQYLRTRSFGEAVAKKLPFTLAPEDVANAVSTQLEPNSLFYKITGTMPAPEQAQELTNTVAQTFLASYASGQQASAANGGSQNQMVQRLTANLQSLDDQIKSYNAQIADLEKQAPSAERDAQLLQLRGQLVTLEASETNAIAALAQIGGQGGMRGIAEVIDQALPGTSVPDQLLRNLAVALLVSLLIGAGIALVSSYPENTVSSPEYLRETLGITPVGAIGTMRSKATTGSGPPTERLTGKGLVTLERPASAEAESFRVLRTNIRFSSLENPVRSLVVTSASPGEGKSLTAANLAIVMAQAGDRVILVDTNLREPHLHELFDMQNNEGFTDLVLDGSTRTGEIIQPVAGIRNLAVVTSGPLPPDPPELLGSDHAVRVMDELGEAADYVIYDSPPVGVVSDAAVLGGCVGVALLVVKAEATRTDKLMHARDALLAAGTRNVLTVLNRVKASKLPDYRYYAGSDAQQVAPNGKVIDGVGERGKLEAGAQKSEAVL